MEESFREQLAGVRARLVGNRPDVRPIVQVTAQLDGISPDEAASNARKTILNWLHEKQQVHAIPESAWAGVPFEIDASQDRPVSVESTDQLWALRYDNPDMNVAGRIWRTEAVIGQTESTALVGIRLTTISRDWTEALFKSVPKVIFDLIAYPGLTDYDFPLTTDPWEPEDDDDVEALVGLLEDPRRTRPVFAISSDIDGETFLDCRSLAERTAGLAHVVLLNPNVSWKLSEQIGDALSVFGGAVRTFRSGFDRYDARFRDHPLATLEWMRRRFTGGREFENVLSLEAINASVALEDLDQRLPGYTTVRRHIVSQRLREASGSNASEAEMLKLYEKENEALEENLAAAEALAEETESKLIEEREEKANLETRVFQLRQRVGYLQELLESKNITQDKVYAQSLKDVEDWIATYLGDNLSVLPRAMRGLKKSVFNDPELICRALELLAIHYTGMRIGRLDRSQFDDLAQELGVEVSPTGDTAQLMQWKEQYEVKWEKQRRFLDLHLKRGVKHDPVTTLRIYFFWDADLERVVVGHMTDHLTNALS